MGCTARVHRPYRSGCQRNSTCVKHTSLTEIEKHAPAAAVRPAQHGWAPAHGPVNDAPPIVTIRNLTKTYASGLQALKPIDLDIRKGEIFALLGPNGAGKTTLISIICGIVTASGGEIHADGHDIRRDYRAARMKIGLVPQELTTDRFETVWQTVTFSRGLFARPPDRAHVERVLRDLSLWEKRKSSIQTLSGGMKRRVMIAKALSHEPTILFLDEPTAGVDVELRRDMWALVRRLREGGVTIILTTHYIDEAEEMADRIGVINKGELILVEEKTALMKKLGSKKLTLVLQEPMKAVPDTLAEWHVALQSGGNELVYTFDINAEHTGVPSLLRRLSDLGIGFRDLATTQSSLEDIFVSLVSDRGHA
jgi:ABC-2 type transport system ATP-binding protein